MRSLQVVSNVRSALAAILLTSLLGLDGCRHAAAGSVRLVPVPVADAFPSAIEEGSLYWACARDQAQLPDFFRSEQQPFEPALVLQRDDAFCHVFYHPTIDGFQASLENDPVSELFLNIDDLSFLAQREQANGDSLDVLRALLPKLDSPLAVTLGVSAEESSPYLQSASRKYFDPSIHRIRYWKTPAAHLDQWVQDYLKAGHAGREPRILVTRSAYEGNAAVATSLAPLLDSFTEPRFVRSKLSFEGGDLIFARHPRDPSRRILFYGTSAKPYWGQALTNDEFAYVLRREFGAGEAVYLGDLTPHADYTLAILGDHPVALLAQPVCGNIELAQEATQLLLQTYGADTPELLRIERLLTNTGESAELKFDKLTRALAQAKIASSAWKAYQDPTVRGRIEEYVKTNCPQQPAACISGPSLARLLDTQRPLLLDWVDIAARVRTGQVMAPRLLAIIERQIAGCGAEDRMSAVRRRLIDLGFRVLPVPWLDPGESASRQWPGISYVNASLIGNRLFLPALGLPRVEEEWLGDLQRQLPSGLQAFLIPARFSLMQNGGIHCVMAFARKPH
ncbi:MAG: hypothetical protein JST93_21635 [Acidobacteria bacterium]|nr:hypothetical protein [Acidobacteriota bacterium]